MGINVSSEFRQNVICRSRNNRKSQCRQYEYIIKRIQSQNYTAITASNFLLLWLISCLSQDIVFVRLRDVHPRNLGSDAFKISQNNLIRALCNIHFEIVGAIVSRQRIHRFDMLAGPRNILHFRDEVSCDCNFGTAFISRQYRG